MSRLLSRYAITIVVLVLLGGTAVALGVIEGFKLEKNPISGPHITNRFSPVCGCTRHIARISFRLRKTGNVTLQVIRGNGKLVRTLVAGKRLYKTRHSFVWNGRDEAGRLVPDGFYKFRLHLGGQSRTIVLPKGTHVDTKRPVVALLAVAPRVISPDGDGARDGLAVHYRVNEQAHVRVLVNGHVAVRGRPIRLQATLYWPGTLHGQPLPAGTFRITVVAQDLAGNLSHPSRAVPIQVRYVSFLSRQIRAEFGSRFAVDVVTDARTVRWHFLGRSGTGGAHPLVLRATKLGRHALFVQAHGHGARVLVDVVKR